MTWRDSSAEHQDSPVPGPRDVRFVICCRNLDITFVWRTKTLEAFHVKCQRQIMHAQTLVSACHKRRNICSHRLTTCYGLHQKMSFVSIRPRSSAHSEDPSTRHPILSSSPSFQSFSWWGLETSSWSSSRSLDWPIPQRHWICSCQPLETDGAMVERRDFPSWLYAMTTTFCNQLQAGNGLLIAIIIMLSLSPKFPKMYPVQLISQKTRRRRQPFDASSSRNPSKYPHMPYRNRID